MYKCEVKYIWLISHVFLRDILIVFTSNIICSCATVVLIFSLNLKELRCNFCPLLEFLLFFFDCLFLIIGLYKMYFYGSKLNYNYFCYQFLLMNYEHMKRGELSIRTVCGSSCLNSYDLIFYFYFFTLSIKKLRKNVLNFPTNDVFLFDHHCIFHSFIVYTLMLSYSVPKFCDCVTGYFMFIQILLYVCVHNASDFLSKISTLVPGIFVLLCYSNICFCFYFK